MALSQLTKLHRIAIKIISSKLSRISTDYLEIIEEEPDKIIDGIKIWKYDVNHELHVDLDGTRLWLFNNNTHREDGPAVEYPDGSEEWWLNGNYHGRTKPKNWEELLEEERIRQVMES